MSIITSYHRHPTAKETFSVSDFTRTKKIVNLSEIIIFRNDTMLQLFSYKKNPASKCQLIRISSKNIEEINKK